MEKLSTKAKMEKLKESVVRLCRSRCCPLTPSEVEDRLRSLFASRHLPLRTPDHPPYSEMISAAIAGLGERGGSREGAISRYIEGKYGDLPFAHPRLLAHHLGEMLRSGEIVLSGRFRYGLPKANAELPELSELPELPKKRCGSRGGGEDEANGRRKLSSLPLFEDSENPDVVLFKKPRRTHLGFTRVNENVCVESRESEAIPVFETEKQIELRHGERESVAKTMPYVDDDGDNNDMPEHGKQEISGKYQAVTSARDGSVLCSLFGEMSVNEMEPLQNLNGHNELPEPGRSKDIHEPKQQLKDKMTALAGEELLVEGHTATPMADDNSVLQSEYRHGETQQQLQGVPLPKKKDGRGRPRKEKPKFEEQLKVVPLQMKKDGRGRPKKKDGRGRPRKKKTESEPQLTVDPLQEKNDGGGGGPEKDKPEFEKQLTLDPLPKKKDGRGRPRKKKTESEPQLAVDPLQGKNDGGGSGPEKDKPEFEKQLTLDPLPKKKDGRGRPRKKKTESELQLAVDPSQEKNDGRDGGPEKEKPESEVQLAVDLSQKKEDYRGRPKRKRPESIQVAVEPLQKENDARGRPKKKIPDSEQQGEEQLVLQDEKIVGSVVDNDFTSILLAELFPKHESGNLEKNKDSIELLEKQQLPRRSPRTRTRKELEASNAVVEDGENNLQVHSEVTGGSLAIESFPFEDLYFEMVKDQSMDPPRKKRSKTTLTHLKEPLLPRQQLRLNNPL